jgi:2-polyprenyl-6-methoxyphenol hydroxylase-like FAD-dependent oxidoreductase
MRHVPYTATRTVLGPALSGRFGEQPGATLLTSRDIAKLSVVREQIRMGTRTEWPGERRRQEFARWLVMQGRISG